MSQMVTVWALPITDGFSDRMKNAALLLARARQDRRLDRDGCAKRFRKVVEELNLRPLVRYDRRNQIALWSVDSGVVDAINRAIPGFDRPDGTSVRGWRSVLEEYLERTLRKSFAEDLVVPEGITVIVLSNDPDQVVDPDMGLILAGKLACNYSGPPVY